MAPGDEQELEWQRRFAASAFNRAWELIDRPDRSSDEDMEMLASAFASRFHWDRVGGDEQRIVGDGGTRALPGHVRVRLELLDERRFGNGMVHLHYRAG